MRRFYAVRFFVDKTKEFKVSGDGLNESGDKEQSSDRANNQCVENCHSSYCLQLSAFGMKKD